MINNWLKRQGAHIGVLTVQLSMLFDRESFVRTDILYRFRLVDFIVVNPV